MSLPRLFPALALAALGALVGATRGVAADTTPPTLMPGVQIERTILPGARASSFAIGLPGGVNFCFDPIRGGLDYAWRGGFVDLTNVRPGMGKSIKAVTLLGPVVYREAGDGPLRRGDASHAPEIEFKGYTLHDASVEFRYTIDGVLVREEISANATSDGLVRRFHVSGSPEEKWWYVTTGQATKPLTQNTSGEFTIEVPFGKAAL